MKQPLPIDLAIRLLETMQEAVWIGDAKEITVHANKRFCELVEYELDEMIGHPSYDFWDEESGRRVRHVNIAKRRKGEKSSYYGTLVSRTGKKIPVLLFGTPLEGGGTAGIMTDLRPLRDIEFSSALFTNAVRQSADAIITLDEKYHITSWNKGAKTSLRYDEKEVQGTTIGTYFPELLSSGTLTTLSRRGRMETDGLTKNGSRVPLSVQITPIRNEEGKTAWLVIGYDNSMKKAFEEEMSRKYTKLEQAYNAFGIVRRQEDYLFELLDLIAKKVPLDEFASFVVSSIHMLTKVDACVLRTFDTVNNILAHRASYGVDDEWKHQQVTAEVGTLADCAFLEHRPLRIIDIRREPGFHSPQLALRHHLTSLLIIPLTVGEERLGTLTLYVREEKKSALFENDFILKYAKLIALGVRG